MGCLEPCTLGYVIGVRGYKELHELSVTRNHAQYADYDEVGN